MTSLPVPPRMRSLPSPPSIRSTGYDGYTRGYSNVFVRYAAADGVDARATVDDVVASVACEREDIAAETARQ
ncbi:MAG: hypothetical protein C0482_29860, partial [Gordonia sp.]|nr:hypothetical protein [Gordonia sp. (in: high G+C Gram-positive bacteria)]